MIRVSLIFQALGVLLLSGCVPAIGPVVINGLDEEIEIRATFQDGHMSAGNLSSSNAAWLGRIGVDDVKMTSLIIFAGGSVLFELKPEELLHWQSENRNQELLVLLVAKNGVFKISEEQMHLYLE